MPGNLLVLQGGGCTQAMNASLAGILGAAVASPVVGRIYGSRRGVLGLLRREVFDLTDQPVDLAALRYTPAALLGSARHKLTEADIDTVLGAIRRLGVRFFHVIGGNDSADTGLRVGRAAAHAGYELHVVTVPKTVDNDLPETDHTPGYGSAARFLALAVMDAGRDNEAMAAVDPVKIIEASGRDAGWLAAASTLARREEEDPPHLVYTPERPFLLHAFLDDVQRTYDRFGRVVVVAAEALRDDAGAYVHANASALYTDSFGHQQLGGVAQVLAEAVASELKLKARYDKPGTVSRVLTACRSEVDIDEAERAGAHAVELATGGTTGVMVTFVREPGTEYHIRLGCAPLERIANQVRRMPPDYLDEEGRVTEAFRHYVEPLIGAPLPHYPRLKRVFAAV